MKSYQFKGWTIVQGGSVWIGYGPHGEKIVRETSDQVEKEIEKGLDK